MNNINTKIALFFISILTMLLISEPIISQCNNLTLSLQPTNSTCLANGKIKVNIGGSDAGNIDPSRVEFQVTGTVNLAFSTYANNTIENLPAGSYTITLRAFCNTSQDWVVAATTASTSITTSYVELVMTLGTPRLSLNCRPTGMIPVSIGANTGSIPFTVDIISAPGTYSGPTTFSTSTRTYQIPNLNAGNYTIRVTDNCGYQISRTATVGLMSQDYINTMFTQYFYPRSTIISGNCNDVNIYRPSISSTTSPNEYHYFYSNSADYFEIDFRYNNSGTPNWQTLPNSASMNYTLPVTIKTGRANSAYVTPYLRVRGTNCIFTLPNITFYPTLYPNVTETAVGCTSLNVQFYPPNNYQGLICFPYQWRIMSGGNVHIGWQGPISDRTSQTATNVPLGSVIEFIDNDGYTWSTTLTSSLPVPYGSYSYNNSFTSPTTNGFFHGYIYLYFNSGFPTGTRFEYVSGPLATPPVHLNVTTTQQISQYFPFSQNYTQLTTNDYKYIEPGTYTFNVYRPGCPVQSIVINYNAYKLVSPFTYTVTEVCDGLEVRPTGGRIDYVSYNGTSTIYSNVYFRIYSSRPDGMDEYIL